MVNQNVSCHDKSEIQSLQFFCHVNRPLIHCFSFFFRGWGYILNVELKILESFRPKLNAINDKSCLFMFKRNEIIEKKKFKINFNSYNEPMYTITGHKSSLHDKEL